MEAEMDLRLDDAPDALLKVAEAAQDSAAGFHKFQTRVTECAPDITALIAKIYEVISNLQTLARTTKDLESVLRYERVQKPFSDVVYSLDYTFKDVYNIVGRGFADPQRRAFSEKDKYRQVWQDINSHFTLESRNTFTKRLDYYRACLQELDYVFLRGSARNQAHFNDLAGRIAALVSVQEPRFHVQSDSSDGSPHRPARRSSSTFSDMRKPPSFERRRPSNIETSPIRPSRPRSRDGGRRNGTDPPRRNRGGTRPPPAPDVPPSPNSSESFSNVSSDLPNGTQNAAATHWLPKLFERPPPMTPLGSAGGSSSICLGRDMRDAFERLEQYVKLFEIPFENGDMKIGLYYRPHDHRARMLCEVIRPEHKDSCVPLTSLDVKRDGPFLKFIIVDDRGRRDLWTCLRFDSYERLVVFFCMFLALRSQDTGHPLASFNDDVIYHEDEYFKGIIRDNHYDHQLKVWKDYESGGIRLQASIITGEMKRTPVWTAFIKYHIHSPSWMRRTSSKSVRLADVQRYVFSNRYSNMIGGQCELSFMDSRDAIKFMDAIEQLVAEDDDDDDRDHHRHGRR